MKDFEVETMQAIQNISKALPQISKRDFFAAFAMNGLLSKEGYQSNPSAVANDAYKMADMMIQKGEE